MNAEYRQTQDDWEDAYNRYRSDPGEDFGGFQSATTSIMRELTACEGEIASLGSEMAALEKCMDGKWES